MRTRRYLIGLAVLGVLVGIAWACGWFAQLPLAQVRSALEERDPGRAEQYLQLASNLGGARAETEFLSARIARRMGQYAEMNFYLGRAEDAGLDARRAERERWLASAQMGHLEGIEKDLIAWLAEGDADYKEICEAYANGLAALARIGDVEALLDAWQQDFPDDPKPHYRRGRLREHERLFTEAEQEYQQALAKDPKFYPAAYSIGRLFLERKKPEAALDYFRLCQELPLEIAADVAIARCLKALGDPDGARELLHAALNTSDKDWRYSYHSVSESPDKALAARELGNIALEAREYQEAERWLKFAIRENPNDLLARYSYATVLRQIGRSGDAELEFRHVHRARTALEEAAKFHDRIARNPADIEARYELGKVLLEHESEQRGLYWLQSVLSYDPNHRPTHRALAEYFESRVAESGHYLSLARRHRAEALEE